MRADDDNPASCLPSLEAYCAPFGGMADDAAALALGAAVVFFVQFNFCLLALERYRTEADEDRLQRERNRRGAALAAPQQQQQLQQQQQAQAMAQAASAPPPGGERRVN